MDELATIAFVVTESQKGERIDVIVTGFLKEVSSNLEDDETFRATRSQVSRWIAEGRVLVNQEPARKAGERVMPGASICVSIPSQAPGRLEPDNEIVLDIIHEESSFLVLNKGPGQVVHPGAGISQGTVVNALLARYGELILSVGSPARPGIVHRLDKDTTGLLVIAKTKRAYESFVEQFALRSISRSYIGLVMKTPKNESPIALPIGRDPRDRTRMAVVKSGKSAITHWRIREGFRIGGFLLELNLETGRTHQIRVHLQGSNAPLVGDEKYPCPEQMIPASLRGAVKQLGRQALHAEKLCLRDPVTSDPREFSAPPPEDFARLIEQFRRAV